MTTLLLYLWVGLVLAWGDVNVKQQRTWRSIFCDVIGWLPIRLGDYLADKVAVLVRFYLRAQEECEDAILQTIFAEVAVTKDALYEGVLCNLQGQEPGWLIYRCALRSLDKRGLIHSDTRVIADHLTEYKHETWYILSKAGIREVMERSLQ